MNLLSVVVNYHTYDLLNNFIDSYFKYVDCNGRELHVVDVEANSLIKKNYFGLTTYDTNVGYAKAVNDAIELYSDLETYPHDVIGIFNADTRFLNIDCVDSCLKLFEDDPQIGIVGPKQYNSKNKITHAGIFGSHKHPAHRGWMSSNIQAYSDVSEAVTVSGSAYFIRRSVWDELTACKTYQNANPSNGAFLQTPHFYEETYCSYHAHKHGYKVIYNGEAHMVHEWNQSGKDNQVFVEQAMKDSQVIFRNACDAHEMEHD